MTKNYCEALFILTAVIFSAPIIKFHKSIGIKKMRYVGLVLIVLVVFGAFNAAGDIGPAIDFFYL